MYSKPVRGFGAGMGASWGPSPRAFQDGSLGWHGFGPMQAYQDGSLGASGSGPLMSYKDGSLGMPLFLETPSGIQELEDPVTLHHGSMGEYFAPRGTGEYFTGMAGCRGCGLGQAASSAPVLDMGTPEVTLEVKQAMAMAPWMLSAIQAPEVLADLDDSVWTKMTVQIVGAWISGYVEFLYAQAQPPAVSKVEFMDTLIAEAFEGEFFVPNALGIRNIYFGATLGAASVKVDVTKAFPTMTQFLAAETAAGTEGGVLPPAIEGQKSSKGGNMLALGLGVAAFALVGMAVMGKKRK